MGDGSSVVSDEGIEGDSTGEVGGSTCTACAGFFCCKLVSVSVGLNFRFAFGTLTIGAVSSFFRMWSTWRRNVRPSSRVAS